MIIFIKILLSCSFIYYLIEFIISVATVCSKTVQDIAMELINKDGGLRNYLVTENASSALRHIFYLWVLGCLIFASWKVDGNTISVNNGDKTEQVEHIEETCLD